jgi:tetratricopeptide (TPR) repeat protein
MRHDDDIDLNESPMPDDWQPEADNDPRWATIARLMAMGDKPPRPLPARFEAMRLELQRELTQEGLLAPPAGSPRHSADPGFLDWLRLILTGGRTGGHVLRLGLASTAAFFLGATLMAPDATTNGDTRLVIRTIEGGEVVSPVTMANATYGPEAPPARSNVVHRSMTSRPADDWAAGAPVGDPWNFPGATGRTLAVPVSIAPAQGPSADGRNALVSEALEQLQFIKLSAMVDSPSRTQPELIRLEQVLSQLREQVEWNDHPKAMALDRFRAAEQALAARRYHQAQQFYDEAARLAPASPLAFLADFQTGRIAYERTQDFALALEAFTKCLKNYPEFLLTAERRTYLEERVALLQESQADQWEGLGHWLAADRARTPQEAVFHLQKVVQQTASGRLLTAAALALRDQALRDSLRQQLNHVDMIEVLRTRAARLEPGPVAATVQFAIAEILACRPGNAAEAAAAYNAALQLGPPADIARVARQRLAGAP